MASTRLSQESSQAAPNDNKRAAETSASPPPAKRGRGRPRKVQKTLEETGGVENTVKDKDIEGDAEVAKQIENDTASLPPAKRGHGRPKKIQNTVKDTNGIDERNVNDMDIKNDKVIAKQIKNGIGTSGEKNAFDEIKADTDDVKKAAAEEEEALSKEINSSVIKDDKREAAIPSSILIRTQKKGIIYFFFRGRVRIEGPQGIEDIARSYMVLRLLPLSAKLGEDRFLVFVEKPSATIEDLREQFSSNDTSHTPSATLFAEGIFAITSTGRESHLAYHLTAPASIGEIQKELGLNEKGSFVVSAKNPKAPDPANATLDNPASYPEEIQKKFRNLRWMPLEPELLNYQNTQFLIIGEGIGEIGKAVEEMSKDAKDNKKEKPVEELEKLQKEDHDRVEHLKGDDPVFADLVLSSKDYSKMQTTW
ncbi:hypothetical protein BKA64DRAFT_759206 [Cadophora sp. MPI-SDFR-AT-0126]|nr:hypothetical protein BKA64DRAFT_759206 [Leotiomycetes sp. MPI-SDFR-AT-0126]